MQTLERTRELAPEETPRRRTRRAFAYGLGAIVLLVVAVLVTYGLTSSRTVTRTVRVEAPKAPVTAARNCVPGAAAGSCNTDEYKEQLIPDKPLNAATRAALAAQLVAARDAALKYPTVADATKAGFILAGKFSPQTGAHYMDLGAVAKFDPARPGSYIYDGISPTSKIAGLMYLGTNTNPPEGFAGPNDHWHRHTNTCVIFGGPQIKVPFAADSSVTKAQCDGVKGTFMKQTIWMVHAWVVPGWDNREGVFAHNHQMLLCADGTYKADAAGFCKGT